MLAIILTGLALFAGRTTALFGRHLSVDVFGDQSKPLNVSSCPGMFFPVMFFVVSISRKTNVFWQDTLLGRFLSRKLV
jgi:hypothetical protein